MEKSRLLRKGSWCCWCVVLAVIYLRAVEEGVGALLNKRLKGWLSRCFKSWLKSVIHENRKMEPPKLIVNLAIRG